MFRREGRYLLRSHMTGEDPAELWRHSMQLTEIEQAFKELKHNLVIRPIFRPLEPRIEAYIFVSFIAYCLLVTLNNLARPHAPGLTPPRHRREARRHRAVRLRDRGDPWAVAGGGRDTGGERPGAAYSRGLAVSDRMESGHPELRPRVNVRRSLSGMRRAMEADIRGIAAALLLLAATPAVAADFDAGVEAYNRGDYASALREFRPLALQGIADAQYNLGVMYGTGQGVPEDDRQAAYWYRQAAEQGDADAQNNLGFMYDHGEGVPEDDRQAVYWYRQAAEQGHAAAQYNLGFMYDHGEGVPEDDRQAVYWYRQAAEHGDADAQNNLGLMYDHGEGVPEDDRQAVYWYQQAAVQGDADAQFALGLMYGTGEGVPEDDRQAVYWYQQAAVQGDADAQFALGLMYGTGEGVPEDDRQAVYWYLQAAEQGHANAQYNLGLMYGTGEGVPEDDRQAVYWYLQAAEQGDADAQNNLGFMYDHGEGVPEDDRQAVYWYQQAAEQGDANAQNNLGLMYAYGEGVPQDFIRAYAWANLAAAAGHEAAKEQRSRIRQLMTPARIAEAQALSRTLVARIESGQGMAAAREKEPLEPKSNGSGFVVGRDGEIVTNHHVVDGCAKVTVSRAGESRDAGVRAMDADNDLALLQAPLAAGTAATFSRSPRARLGEAVTVAGYPLQGLLSNQLNVTSGNVSALASLGDDVKRLQITAPVQPGNSGGPLLDAAGNVVGVVVSKLDAVRTAELTGDIPQNVNFAIKGALVRGFLDIHGVAYRRQASDAKLALDLIAEQARGFTVAVHCWE